MKIFPAYAFIILPLLSGLTVQTARGQLLDEEFSSISFPHSAFDPNATEGLLGVNSDSLYLSMTNSWNSLYVTSDDSWDRTNGSGKVLQATFFVKSLSDGGTLVTFSLIDFAGIPKRSVPKSRTPAIVGQSASTDIRLQDGIPPKPKGWLRDKK